MATTVENRVRSDAKVLQSYLGGKWQAGAGEGAPLINPTTGDIVASASSKGLDLSTALSYSRNVGGAELRKLTYAQRAELLGKIADVLAARREEWFEIARKNSGNTKADAMIDIDGSIGTLKYFAKIGAKLGDARMLRDGAPSRLARDQNFQGLHVGVPLDGVAVHINAFNFPAWGLWEKAAVSLLAGVPVLAKPATSTAWLAQEMINAVIEAGVLPPGALSILCGSPNDLLDHLQLGDVVAFTGSADTGESIRQHPRVRKQNIRVNIEADSLNAALLGPDAQPDSMEFAFFAREVVREMTSKTGQKCTAIRRVLVPDYHEQAAIDAISAQLKMTVVGDPANALVSMGPVVNMAQRKSIGEGIAQLNTRADVAYEPDNFSPSMPTPSVAPSSLPCCCALVKKVMTMSSTKSRSLGRWQPLFPTAIKMTRSRWPGVAADRWPRQSSAPIRTFLAEAGAALGTTHGRLLLVDPSIRESHTGHGIVLPSCMHGGPGRAGGGEELGGLHGLWFYHQRVAVQGAGPTLAALSEQAVDPHE